MASPHRQYRTDTNDDGVINDLDTPNDDAIGLAIDNLDVSVAMIRPAVSAGITLPINFFSVYAEASSPASSVRTRS